VAGNDAIRFDCWRRARTYNGDAAGCSSDTRDLPGSPYVFPRDLFD